MPITVLGIKDTAEQNNKNPCPLVGLHGSGEASFIHSFIQQALFF